MLLLRSVLFCAMCPLVFYFAAVNTSGHPAYLYGGSILSAAVLVPYSGEHTLLPAINFGLRALGQGSPKEPLPDKTNDEEQCVCKYIYIYILCIYI